MRKMPLGMTSGETLPRPEESHPAPLREGGLVDQFVETLNRFERHVLLLYYVEGLTPMEIGAVLDEPGQRVYAVLAELKQRTRQAMRDQHVDITERADDARSMSDSNPIAVR